MVDLLRYGIAPHEIFADTRALMRALNGQWKEGPEPFRITAGTITDAEEVGRFLVQKRRLLGWRDWGYIVVFGPGDAPIPGMGTLHVESPSEDHDEIGRVLQAAQELLGVGGADRIEQRRELDTLDAIVDPDKFALAYYVHWGKGTPPNVRELAEQVARSPRVSERLTPEECREVTAGMFHVEESPWPELHDDALRLSASSGFGPEQLQAVEQSRNRILIVGGGILTGRSRHIERMRQLYVTHQLVAAVAAIGDGVVERPDISRFFSREAFERLVADEEHPNHQLLTWYHPWWVNNGAQVALHTHGLAAFGCEEIISPVIDADCVQELAYLMDCIVGFLSTSGYLPSRLDIGRGVHLMLRRVKREPYDGTGGECAGGDEPLITFAAAPSFAAALDLMGI